MLPIHKNSFLNSIKIEKLYSKFFCAFCMSKNNLLISIRGQFSIVDHSARNGFAFNSNKSTTLFNYCAMSMFEKTEKFGSFRFGVPHDF